MEKMLKTVLEKIHSLGEGQDGRPLIVAIDGRCAAGKTTLAAHLKGEIPCNVLPMDDFFLRPEQRTKDRLSQPGGNVDYERFRKEVLLPLRQGREFSYRPYDCHRQTLMQPIPVRPETLAIVEGSYCCHPSLWDFYDLRIFLTLEPDEQLRRIQHRNGPAGLTVFRERWIPLEERYFAAFQIAGRCDLLFHTDLCKPSGQTSERNLEL